MTLQIVPRTFSSESCIRSKSSTGKRSAKSSAGCKALTFERLVQLRMIHQYSPCRFYPSQSDLKRLIHLSTQPSSPRRGISLCYVGHSGPNDRSLAKHRTQSFGCQLAQADFVRSPKILFEQWYDIQEETGAVSVHAQEKVMGIGEDFEVGGSWTTTMCQLDLREMLENVSARFGIQASRERTARIGRCSFSGLRLQTSTMSWNDGVSDSCVE